MKDLQKEYLAYQQELAGVPYAISRFDELPAYIEQEKARVVEHQAKLDAIQATLTKPWNEYAGNGRKLRYTRYQGHEPQHPIARQAYREWKQVQYGQEAIAGYEKELLTRDQTIREAEEKRALLEPLLELVKGQLERKGLPVPTKGYPGAHGQRCLAEVVGIREAAAAIQKYWDDVAREIAGGFRTSGIAPKPIDKAA